MTRWRVPERFKVIVGGNTYINTPNVIVYKGESLFELARSKNDGFLAINFDVFGPTGARVATIRNAQFVGDTPLGYTLDLKADHFTLTEDKTGRAVCELRLREKAVDDVEIDVSARMFMPDGFLIELTPQGTNLPGAFLKGNVMENCNAGISIN